MARRFLGLDVGEKRIGIAEADSSVRIAIALDTLEVDGDEVQKIIKIIIDDEITDVIVGYPRNQSGEATAQTKFVENFIAKLGDIGARILYQDESLTSVIAEQRLKATGKPYDKGDIDAQAACIILEDYLEINLK